MDTSRANTTKIGSYNNAAEVAISIHLISNKILPHLSFQDLLNCSLVSKGWNRTMRAHLREARVCVASIRRPVTCKELSKFSNLLSTSGHHLPFNGLSIEMTRSWHTCVDNCEPENAYEIIANKFPLKYLKVQWTKAIQCPMETFISLLYAGMNNNNICLAGMCGSQYLHSSTTSTSQALAPLIAPYCTPALSIGQQYQQSSMGSHYYLHPGMIYLHSSRQPSWSGAEEPIVETLIKPETLQFLLQFCRI